MAAIKVQRYNFNKIIILILFFLAVLFLLQYELPGKTGREKALNQARQEPSPYGEFLDWPQVNIIFPKYAKASVIDLETGLGFMVQRRAGSYHADVQPLTADDTAVMKKIYQGSWSWKRRAVVLHLGSGRKIAASMNGMPHGGGAIRGNNFNGHFCLHFRDSKTHITGQQCPYHQMMVWKAAGRVDEQLSVLPADQVIKFFFRAISQDEREVAEKILGGPSLYTAVLLQELGDLQQVRTGEIEKTEDPRLFEVTVYLTHWDPDSKTKKLVNKNINIRTVCLESYGWRIDPNSLLILLDREAWEPTVNITPEPEAIEEEENNFSEPW